MTGLVAAGLFAIASTAVADEKPVRLDFKANQKRVDRESNHKGNKTVGHQVWSYTVDVQNRAFEDTSNLEFRYKIYVRSDDGTQTRSRQDIRSESGSYTAERIPRSGSITFETDPVKLNESKLDARWRYTNGSSFARKDSLAGVWIKVFRNGVEVADFCSPYSLAKNVTWD